MNQQQQGRRYRQTETYVRDWATFKSVWASSDFIKSLDKLSQEKRKQFIREKFMELIMDENKQCYLFPSSLKEQYITVMKALVKQKELNLMLDYEHEGLYIGNQKQLIVYKKRASIAIYLSKYRFPEYYKKLFEEILNLSQQLKHKIIAKNLLISKQQPKQAILLSSKDVEDYRENKLYPKLAQWRKLVNNFIKDFKSQPSKQQMVFIGVNTLLRQQINKLSIENQLYVRNRYQNVSQFDEYRDITLTKQDRNQSSSYFDDQSEESNTNDNPDHKQLQQKLIEPKRQAIVKVNQPKSIDAIIFHQFTQFGAKCFIQIPQFGTSNRIDQIIVRFKPQKGGEQQIKFEQRIKFQKDFFSYETLLPCLISGCHAFQILTFNEAGFCKKPFAYFIYMESGQGIPNQQGMLRINNKNYTSFILGQNQVGAIPNWENNDNIVRTTLDQWQKIKYPCSDFSVSDQAVISNRKGQVAGWGKMHFFDPDEIQKTSDEDENDDLGLIELNNHNYRSEKPCLILESKNIRKVSCGDGYCLMADSFGNAWSFGINFLGQLGYYRTQQLDTTEPTLIDFFKVEKIFVREVIASSFGASFAISSQNTAYRWGTNQIDCSGRPIKDSFNNVINYECPTILAAQPIPIEISKKLISEKIVSIHPGNNFVLALSQSNVVYGWGSTKNLGLKCFLDSHFQDIENICNPVPLHKNIKKVSSGKNHCVALTTENTLVGWGDQKCYNEENSKKFICEPQTIIKNCTHDFTCGPDFTVLIKESKIEVLGNRNIFKAGLYQLPCKLVKLQAGEGVIMVMGVQPNNEQKKKQQTLNIQGKSEGVNLTE